MAFSIFLATFVYVIHVCATFSAQHLLTFVALSVKHFNLQSTRDCCRVQPRESDAYMWVGAVYFHRISVAKENPSLPHQTL